MKIILQLVWLIFTPLVFAKTFVVGNVQNNKFLITESTHLDFSFKIIGKVIVSASTTDLLNLEVEKRAKKHKASAVIGFKILEHETLPLQTGVININQIYKPARAQAVLVVADENGQKTLTQQEIIPLID